MAGITVGIDGSLNSHRALDWAVREAAVRRCGLTVLIVHPAVACCASGSPLTVPTDKALQARERQAAEEAVGQALNEAGLARPATVRVASVIGLAVEKLIDASKKSDLLVIGARGAGDFHWLMLGSVSGQVVHHSACPVVVVPGPER